MYLICSYLYSLLYVRSSFSLVTSVTRFIPARKAILFDYVWCAETFSDRLCDTGPATRTCQHEWHARAEEFTGVAG